MAASGNRLVAANMDDVSLVPGIRPAIEIAATFAIIGGNRDVGAAVDVGEDLSCARCHRLINRRANINRAAPDRCHAQTVLQCGAVGRYRLVTIYMDDVRLRPGIRPAIKHAARMAIIGGDRHHGAAGDVVEDLSCARCHRLVNRRTNINRAAPIRRYAQAVLQCGAVGGDRLVAVNMNDVSLVPAIRPAIKHAASIAIIRRHRDVGAAGHVPEGLSRPRSYRVGASRHAAYLDRAAPTRCHSQCVRTWPRFYQPRAVVHVVTHLIANAIGIHLSGGIAGARRDLVCAQRILWPGYIAPPVALGIKRCCNIVLHPIVCISIDVVAVYGGRCRHQARVCSVEIFDLYAICRVENVIIGYLYVGA